MNLPAPLPLLLTACLLAMSGCSGTAEGESQQPAGTSTVAASTELTGLPGVDMSSLTPQQRRQALKLFQTSSCDCSCGMTIAVCRVDDPNCGRSPVIAANVIRLMAEGKTVDQAAAAAFNKAGANEMVFDVPVGKTFFDGPQDATVTLITFLDYQWPFCARVGPTLERLRQEFPDDLRVVYKHRPLPNHYWAMVASEAVMAARAQGKFLEMDRLLFARQEDIPKLLNSKALAMGHPKHDQEVQREVFIELAAQLGLDVDRVRRDLENRTYQAQIEAESAEALRVGAKGTPSSFVNGRYIPGAKPLELFRREVQKEIDWARNGNRPAFPIGTDVTQQRPPQPAPKPAATPKPATVQAKELVFDVPAGDAFSVGPPGASVTLISFLDYQWPFCARVGPTLEKLHEAFPDDLRIVFKQHPLPFHYWARVASEAALSAGAQGQFFEMDRLIFSQQKEIPDLLREKAIEMDMPNQLKDEAVQREVFIDLAAQLNLDQAQMRHDLENQTYLPQVEAETADSLRVGAKGTPASFINGRYLSGAKPFETFQKEIQSEIDWARNGNRPDFEKGTDIAELIPAWQREPDPDKVYDLEAGDASYLGASNAKVTILHYLDYQWPFCERVGPTLDRLTADYPDTVRVVYKMYPLSRHPFAQMAAQASLAAANQGRFKEMHDLLFDSYRHFATLAATAAQELGVPATEAESPQVQTALFMGLAEQLGLDMDRFEADLHSRATLRRIARDTQEVRSTGNPGTPASYVNGRYVKGAKPYEAFKEIVDQALKEAGSAVAADSIP